MILCLNVFFLEKIVEPGSCHWYPCHFVGNEAPYFQNENDIYLECSERFLGWVEQKIEYSEWFQPQ